MRTGIRSTAEWRTLAAGIAPYLTAPSLHSMILTKAKQRRNKVLPTYNRPYQIGGDMCHIPQEWYNEPAVVLQRNSLRSSPSTAAVSESMICSESRMMPGTA
ncbi:unnamed protein product [Sphagnum balticum]